MTQLQKKNKSWYPDPSVRGFLLWHPTWGVSSLFTWSRHPPRPLFLEWIYTQRAGNARASCTSWCVFYLT